ncbi:MAG: STAS domain-containing protein [Gaiellaceae bacterium]
MTSTERLGDHPVAGIDQQGEATIVRLQGELDLYNADAVRDALAAVASEAPERLVVELSAVSFIDSTALGVLIEARTKLVERRAFLLAAPRRETLRALEVSGLDRHFSIHPTVDEALSAGL